MVTDYTDPKHDQKGDVESFMDDIRRFWDKFGLTVLLIVLGVLIFLLLTRFVGGRQERAREEAYAALSAAESPFAMEDVADRYNHVPGFSGYALLQAADLRVREALGLIALPGRDARISEAQRQQGLEQAAELYQQVVEQNESSLQVLNARLGLASVYESLGQFDRAAEQYKKVQQAADQWPALAVRAESRLASLDEIQTPITFPPPKPPKPADPYDALVPDVQLDELFGPAPEPKDIPSANP